MFREQAPGSKQKQQLYEYAACYQEPALAGWLASEAGFGAARGYEKQLASLGRKSFAAYYAKNVKDILRQCDQHGVEHRTPMNQTPLMAAARAGNVPLLEALLARGADPLATDHYGRNALHWAMQEAFDTPAFARGPFAAIHELVAPASIDVQAGERLVRIDRHLAEYFLFQTLWVLFKSRFTHAGRRPYCAFDTAAVLSAWEYMPANVVRPERNQRPHVSSVLSRNEVDREYAYNRALFWRVAQGWYQFNPALAVRRRVAEEEIWQPLYQALNLPLIHEFTPDFHWDRARDFLARANLPPPSVPVAAERWVQRVETQARELAEQEATLRAALESRRRAAATHQDPSGRRSTLGHAGSQAPRDRAAAPPEHQPSGRRRVLARYPGDIPTSDHTVTTPAAERTAMTDSRCALESTSQPSNRGHQWRTSQIGRCVLCFRSLYPSRTRPTARGGPMNSGLKRLWGVIATAARVVRTAAAGGRGDGVDRSGHRSWRGGPGPGPGSGFSGSRGRAGEAAGHGRR